MLSEYKKISIGKSGDIYKCYSYKYNCNIVVKKKNQNEIDILQTLDHPNIIKYFEYDNDKLLLEYLDGYDGIDYCEIKYICLKELFEIFKQICQAVNYCHRKNVYHLDIKPENIMICGKKTKLIDFDLAVCSKEPKISKYCGTALYCCPQILGRVPYDPKKADIWSIGVTMYVLYESNFPWIGENDQKMLLNAVNGIWLESKTDELNQIFDKIFIVNEEDRMNMLELIQEINSKLGAIIS